MSPTDRILAGLLADQKALEDRLQDCDLLEPEARVDRAAEHRQIEEDLDLLAWLIATTPESSDIAVLRASLVRRMRQHVERDGRLLSRAARLHD